MKINDIHSFPIQSYPTLYHCPFYNFLHSSSISIYVTSPLTLFSHLVIASPLLLFPHILPSFFPLASLCQVFPVFCLSPPTLCLLYRAVPLCSYPPINFLPLIQPVSFPLFLLFSLHYALSSNVPPLPSNPKPDKPHDAEIQ